MIRAVGDLAFSYYITEKYNRLRMHRYDLLTRPQDLKRKTTTAGVKAVAREQATQSALGRRPQIIDLTIPRIWFPLKVW